MGIYGKFELFMADLHWDIHYQGSSYSTWIITGDARDVITYGHDLFNGFNGVSLDLLKFRTRGKKKVCFEQELQLLIFK